MEVEKILHMNSGQGDTSYAQNSFLQEISLNFLEPFLQESISQMKILQCERFCIADLGCSTGPNTFFVSKIISRAMERKYVESYTSIIPEFQVFFCDLASNDFNVLFQSMPPLINHLDENNGHSMDDRSLTRSYFAACVSGSFYKRLFPRNTLHFVHSSYSLHWLSQVPIEVQDKTLRSWNKERVFISKHGPIEVAEAYLHQFQKDFNSFLTSRAQEVIPGGIMFLYLSGRSASDLRDQGASGIIGEILEAAFNDLVIEGMIEEENRDSFNLPFFSPSVQELKVEIEKEGSFIIKRLQFLSGVVEKATCEDTIQMRNIEGFERMLAKQFRAILESLISIEFGGEIVDPLFYRFEKRATDKICELLKSNCEGGGILVVLERQ